MGAVPNSKFPVTPVPRDPVPTLLSLGVRARVHPHLRARTQNRIKSLQTNQTEKENSQQM